MARSSSSENNRNEIAVSIHDSLGEPLANLSPPPKSITPSITTRLSRKLTTTIGNPELNALNAIADKHTLNDIITQTSMAQTNQIQSGSPTMSGIGQTGSPKTPNQGLGTVTSVALQQKVIEQAHKNTWWFLAGLYSTKCLFLVVTVTAVVTAIVFSDELREKYFQNSGLPVWKTLMYVASLYPLWEIAEVLVLISTALVRFIVRNKARSYNIVLFFKRYKYAISAPVWGLLLLISWIIFLSPVTLNIGAIEVGDEQDANSTVIHNWDYTYNLLKKLHVVLILYFLGTLLVQFIAFKFLHQFAASHQTLKIFTSLFDEVILLALAGSAASEGVTVLLPKTMFSNTEYDDKTKHRIELAAARYALMQQMEEVFAPIVGVETRDTKEVCSHLLNLICADIQEPEAVEDLSSGIRMLTGPLPKNLFKPWKRAKKKNGRGRGLTADQNIPGKDELLDQRVTKANIQKLLENAYGKDIKIDEAIKQIDPTPGDYVTIRTLWKYVEQSFADRSNLVTALRDTQAVTNQVTGLIHFVVNFFVVFISLIIFNIDVIQLWVSFSSIILAFSFVFGSTLSTMFENVIYLYASHPYDVGDVLQLGAGREIWIVKRVLLQTTQMESLAGEVRTMQNNALRVVEPMVNLTQSKGYWIETYFAVDAAVISKEFLEKVNADIEAFIITRPDLYQGYFRIDYYNYEAPMKVKLCLGATMAISFARPGLVKKAHSELSLVFIQSLNKYGGTKYTTYVDFNREPMLR